MENPDAMLAFKLLDTAWFTVKDKQLVLIPCPSLSFVNIKSDLKRIFGKNSPQESAGELRVNGGSVDPAYYTTFTAK